MNALAELAQQQTSRRASEAADNRAHFPIVEMGDALKPFQPRLRYARNEAGEEIGESYESRLKRMGAVECQIYLYGYPK